MRLQPVTLLNARKPNLERQRGGFSITSAAAAAAAAALGELSGSA